MTPRLSHLSLPVSLGLLTGALSPLGTPTSRAEDAADNAPRSIFISHRIIAAPEVADQIKLKEPIVIEDDLRVTHVGVGTLEPTEGGKLRFVPVDKIAREVGRFFGWVVRFDTPRDALELTEEFNLPANNLQWTVDSERTAISDSGRKATTRHTVEALWDWTSNFWSFEEGDPSGEHKFVVRFGEVEIADLTFQVVEPDS